MMCFDLSDLGIIRVSGPDAEKFLQGQLTCDVKEINAQQSRLGAYCNHKGRILASFRLFYYQDNYYLILPRPMISCTLPLLQKFAAFSQAQLQNASDDFIHLGCHSADDNFFFSQKIKIPSEINGVNANDAKIILRVPSHAGIRFEVLIPSSQASDLEFVINEDRNQWTLFDIQAGVATIYPETREMFTPHMLNYPAFNAVSFTKGCYVGQEVIARTHYLGQSKRQLTTIEMNCDHLPQPGEKIMDEKKQEIGHVVVAAKNTNHLYSALAVTMTNISNTIDYSVKD